MSSGLLIVSLVVLAIGLMTGAIGYLIGHTSSEKYYDINYGRIFFNRAQCDNQTISMGPVLVL